MDAIFEPQWRIWPSILSIALGAWALWRSVAHERRYFGADAMDMTKPLALARGLRLMLLGVSLVTFGFAWIFQVVWLWWLALIFGAEETWETSLIVSGLRQSDRFHAQHALARSARPRSSA
jgi:hypothetical protein